MVRKWAKQSKEVPLFDRATQTVPK
jgi:hypothetical protein